MYNKSPKIIEALDKLCFPLLLNNASADKELILIDDISPAKQETDAFLENFIYVFSCICSHCISRCCCRINKEHQKNQGKAKRDGKRMI
jgi:hypothetical protein